MRRAMPRSDPGIFRRCGCTEVVVDAAGAPVLTPKGKPKRRELGSKCPELERNPKHGHWGFQADVAPIPGSGKERQRIRRTGFPTKSEAKAERNKIMGTGEKAANRRVPNDRATVGEYLERWLEGRRGLRPKTMESYTGHVTKYLVPYLGPDSSRPASPSWNLPGVREIGESPRWLASPPGPGLTVRPRSAGWPTANAQKAPSAPGNPGEEGAFLSLGMDGRSGVSRRWART
jgi:hypothetical protein